MNENLDQENRSLYKCLLRINKHISDADKALENEVLKISGYRETKLETIMEELETPTNTIREKYCLGILTEILANMQKPDVDIDKISEKLNSISVTEEGTDTPSYRKMVLAEILNDITDEKHKLAIIDLLKKAFNSQSDNKLLGNVQKILNEIKKSNDELLNYIVKFLQSCNCDDKSLSTIEDCVLQYADFKRVASDFVSFYFVANPMTSESKSIIISNCIKRALNIKVIDTKDTYELNVKSDGSCFIHCLLTFLKQSDMDEITEFVDKNDREFKNGKTFLQTVTENFEKAVSWRIEGINKIQVLYLRTCIALNLEETALNLKETSSHISSLLYSEADPWISADESILLIIAKTLKKSVAVFSNSSVYFAEYNNGDAELCTLVYDMDSVLVTELERTNEKIKNGLEGCNFNQNNSKNSLISSDNNLVAMHFEDSHYKALIKKNNNESNLGVIEKSFVVRSNRYLTFLKKLEKRYTTNKDETKSCEIRLIIKSIEEEKTLDDVASTDGFDLGTLQALNDDLFVSFVLCNDPEIALQEREKDFISRNRRKINVKKVLASLGIIASVALPALALPIFGIPIAIAVAAIGLIGIAISSVFIHKARTPGNLLDAYKSLDKVEENSDINKTMEKPLSTGFRHYDFFQENVTKKHFKDVKETKEHLKNLIEPVPLVETNKSIEK